MALHPHSCSNHHQREEDGDLPQKEDSRAKSSPWTLELDHLVSGPNDPKDPSDPQLPCGVGGADTERPTAEHRIDEVPWTLVTEGSRVANIPVLSDV